MTATGQSALGYVSVAPSLTTGVEPSTSRINFPLRTVPLAAGGRLDFMHWAGGGGTIGVIFDVTGDFE